MKIRIAMFELMDRHFLKRPLLRRALTRIVAGNRQEDVTLLSSDYRVHTVREHGLFRAARLALTCSLFRDELPILLHLAGILQDGDTFLDIGANVGVFAVNIAKFRVVYPKLHVYAFEPNPDTADRLKANAERFGVKVFALALSDRDGALEFVDGAVSNVFTTVENASAYAIRTERTMCECRRLDSLTIEGNSLILKIDVEGQEWEVLRGALPYFESNRVKAVYLDDKEAKVRSFLDGFGFRYFNGRTLQPANPQTKHLLAVKPGAT